MSSFLTGFSSNLQITRTGIKSLRSSNSGNIRLITVELPTLECWKSPYLTLSPGWHLHFLLDLCQTLSKQERHKVLDEFECGPDWTVRFGVTFSWVPRKSISDIRSIAPSFAGNQDTGIKYWMSSNFGQIGHFTWELLALEHRNIFPYTYPPFTLSDIFSSKAIGPIETKFHVLPPWVRGTYVCTNCQGHLTKMATMPIYGKIPFKTFFSGTKRPHALKLCIQHQGSGPTKFIQMVILGWPWHSLGAIRAKSNLLSYAFVWENVKTVDFIETIDFFELKVGTYSLLSEYMKTYEQLHKSTWGKDYCLTIV